MQRKMIYLYIIKKSSSIFFLTIKNIQNSLFLSSIQFNTNRRFPINPLHSKRLKTLLLPEPYKRKKKIDIAQMSATLVGSIRVTVPQLGSR